MSFFVSAPDGSARAIPGVVWSVLEDASVLSHEPPDGAPLNEYIFSSRKCEAWCGCVVDSKIKATRPRETGGVFTWPSPGKLSVTAHLGLHEAPSVTRYLDRPAPVGFHSHIIVGNRSFNPPTTADAILYIRMREQPHEIKREAELVFTEEGVYVIHSGATDPAFESDEEIRKGVREGYMAHWPHLVQQGHLDVDKAEPGVDVPFFLSKADLDKYLAIFTRFGVYIDLIGWDETKLRVWRDTNLAGRRDAQGAAP